MIAEAVAQVFEGDETGKAAIGHGYTYSGHPVGAAAALATLAETKRLKRQRKTPRPRRRASRGPSGAATETPRHRRCPRRPRPDARGRACLRTRHQGRARQGHPRPHPEGRLPGRRDDPRLGPKHHPSPPLVLTSADVQTILSALDAGLSRMSDFAALLGTKGGPMIRPGPGSTLPTSSLLSLAGPARGGRLRLGVARGLTDQGMSLKDLSLIFITHLHSDTTSNSARSSTPPGARVYEHLFRYGARGAFDAYCRASSPRWPSTSTPHRGRRPPPTCAPSSLSTKPASMRP